MNQTLFDRYKKAEGASKTAIMNDIVKEEMPLVKKTVRRFLRNWKFNRSTFRQDLEQEASIGLFKAVDKWRPDLGPWEVFATFWMRSSLQKAVCGGILPEVPPEAGASLELDTSWNHEEAENHPVLVSFPDVESRLDAERLFSLLSKTESQVVAATVLQEKTVREVAQLAHVGKSSVRNIRNRALARMRRSA